VQHFQCWCYSSHG